jgi:hypothetical protein
MLPERRKNGTDYWAVLAGLALNLLLFAYCYGKLTDAVGQIDQRVQRIERLLDSGKK